jgi:hypothetical protein
MAMLDATQVRRQRVAARLARRSLGLGAGGRRSRLSLTTQALELLTRAASSSTSVSSNRRRWSAFMASDLAP